MNGKVTLQTFCVLSRGYAWFGTGDTSTFAASVDHDIQDGSSWDERRSYGVWDGSIGSWGWDYRAPGWNDADR